MQQNLVYDALENYALLLFKEIDPAAVWEFPYFKTIFSNGDPMRDANPIFSARNKKDGTVFKIILDEDQGELHTYIHQGVEEKVTVYLMDQTTYLNKLKGLFAEIVGHCAGYKID